MKISVTTDHNFYPRINNNRLCFFLSTMQLVNGYAYDKVAKRLYNNISKKLEPALYVAIDL